MKSIDETTKHRYGTVNFERRKHPRVNIDLPVEYYQVDSTTHHNGRAINASEVGLLLYLPEQIEIDQYLTLKLFFTSGSELNTTEILVKVVWVDIHLEKDWGDYRTGVRFIDISPEDMTKLKNFLKSLLG
ncbi:MAG: PilZ domain-containing protein [Thermodesulfobacteriota bacterium]